MLNKLEMLYPSMPHDTLSLLLDAAKQFAMDYCGLTFYDEALNGTVLRMAQEDINSLYAEGFLSESAEGSSVSYTNDYSPRIYKTLNRFKRVKTVGSGA